MKNDSGIKKRISDLPAISKRMSQLDINIQNDKLALQQVAPALQAVQDRAKFAEQSLQASEKAFDALSLLLKNSLETIRETEVAIQALKATIKKNDRNISKKDLALSALIKINESNRASMKANAIVLSSLEELAYNDPLTNLPNRRLLKDRLDRAFINNSRNKSYSAILFFDLDNFKRLNDQCGHEAGDALLTQVAKRLQNCVRESDTVARYGGDEFVVILCNLQAGRTRAKQEANVIAQYILKSLSAPYPLKVSVNHLETFVEYQCFVSIGVAMFNSNATIKTQILDWADEAMYWAKSEGGHAIRFYDKLQSTERTLSNLYRLATSNDIETASHGIRCREYVKTLARRAQIMNLYPNELTDTIIDRMFKTTQLHDIGKTQIPYTIIHKQSKLTPDEWTLMKTHTTIGESILENTKKKNAHLENFLNMAIDIAVAHHEHWDGSGYPKGLTGTNIPLGGRIMAFADVYDALISTRSYKQGWRHEDACKQIIANSSTQFDPLLMKAFILESDSFKSIAEHNKDG